MKIADKYLVALKAYDDWVIVSEWARKVGELYPDILEKAEIEAANQVSDTTGLREIAARISANIAGGVYLESIEIDSSERPRRVKYIPEEERNEHEIQELEDDVAPLRRDEIIKQAINSMGSNEKYRNTELESISKQLKQFFGLDFEVDHAKALLNTIDPGQHSPDNLQLLLKAHNSKKSNNNWDRFSLEEQIEYIESAIRLQQVVASRLDIDMENDVLGSLIDRLKNIY